MLFDQFIKFNIEDFKDYSKEMEKLQDILNALRDLSIYSDKTMYVGSQRIKGSEHLKYFNEQNKINNERNNEYIESMMKYVVKRQKELVDDMHSKLKLDQIEEEEEFDISEPPELPELHDPHETSKPPKPPEIPERYKLDENK